MTEMKARVGGVGVGEEKTKLYRPKKKGLQNKKTVQENKKKVGQQRGDETEHIFTGVSWC